MLFYLTDSLIVEGNDPKYKEICTAIYHLAIQSVNGNHALIGEIKAIAHFRKTFESDYLVGSLFNKIYQNISFEVVPSFISYYVEVVIKEPSVRTEGDKTIAQVEYNRLIPLETTNKTALVCEFLSDADFYSFVLKWYMRQLGINAHFSFRNVDGGGTNTHMNIKNELKDDHITLSIVDTDCRYPGDKVKDDSTYGKCKGIGDGNVLFKLIPLEVHELENLVPLNFIDQEFPNWTKGDADYERKKRAFDYLKKNAEKILPYFDIKKGIIYNEAYRKSTELQSFAKLCYQQNDDLMAIQPDFDQYVASLPDKAKIYRELISGTGTINMVLNLIERGNAPAPSLFNYQKQNWDVIGQGMLNWCFARRPEAIH